MKFSYTHHMPYTFVDDANQDWPVANKQFDPKKGVELYREYIDKKFTPRRSASTGSAATSIT